MIIEEIIYADDGRQLVKTYSDANKYIIQDDSEILYGEAIDIPGVHRYSESNIDIEIEENEENKEVEL